MNEEQGASPSTPPSGKHINPDKNVDGFAAHGPGGKRKSAWVFHCCTVCESPTPWAHTCGECGSR